MKKRRHVSQKIMPITMENVATIVHPKHAPILITLFEYSAKSCVEKTLTFDEVDFYQAPKDAKLWLNVHGVHDADLINKIGKKFNLHPLVIEDILNVEQRPKLDTFDDYLFLEANCFYYDKEMLAISAEQISIVLDRSYLLTFQQRSTGIFEPIRERLRAEKGQMRCLGVDYIAYAVLDTIVDSYFGVLDGMADDCEVLEDTLLVRPSNKELHDLHQLKRASIDLRRSVWPLREVVNHLTRNETNFIEPHTLPYMRDVYDHTVHFIESLEAQRDMLGGMMDIYLSTVSNRVNLEVRALTVVAMLFMPATLIAGIFGMNFVHMPWIDHYNGFWYAMAIMVGIALVMLMIFWRRQWLSSKS
ncbi:MAG: magnesium/cobalt transporter CorA [Methylophilaceae bacterium]